MGLGPDPLQSVRMHHLHEDPECLSLILCDAVYRDAITGKWIIVGVFNEIVTPTVPFVQPLMAIALTLTNARGTFDLALAIEHEESGVEMFRQAGPMTVDNPLHLVDIQVTLGPLEFKVAGKYWLKVLFGERIASQRPFRVSVAAERVGQHGTQD